MSKLARILYALTPYLILADMTKASCSQLRRVLLKKLWNWAFGDYAVCSGFYLELVKCLCAVARVSKDYAAVGEKVADVAVAVLSARRDKAMWPKIDKKPPVHLPPGPQ